MHVQSITYEDFEGNEVTKDFRFHLTKLELAELELTLPNGLEGTIKMLGDADQVRSAREAYPLFKDIIISAYGEKRPDGQGGEIFDKSREARDRFEYSPALGELIFSLLEDPEKGGKFLEQCLPAKLVAEAKAMADAGEAPSQLAKRSDTVEPVPGEDTTPPPVSDEDLLQMKPEEMNHEQLKRALQLKGM